MPELNTASNDLAPHIEQGVQSIARLRVHRHHSATPQERAVERITTVLGRMNSIVALGMGVVVWIGVNLLAGVIGCRPFAIHRRSRD